MSDSTSSMAHSPSAQLWASAMMESISAADMRLSVVVEWWLMIDCGIVEIHNGMMENSASTRAGVRDNHEMKKIIEQYANYFSPPQIPTSLTGREKANPWVDETQIAATMARLRSIMMLMGLYFFNAIVDI
jgi:hypothetical protein